MALATRFTELVGCRVPVQQAPMGSVSTSALAVAVADAGGVGSITALGLTAGELDKVLAIMAARTTGVLAANFLTGDIDREAVAAAAGAGADPRLLLGRPRPGAGGHRAPRRRTRQLAGRLAGGGPGRRRRGLRCRDGAGHGSGRAHPRPQPTAAPAGVGARRA